MTDYDFGPGYFAGGREAIEGANIIPLPGMETLSKLTATPYIWRDPGLLPRQQFLYGFELQRGHLSGLVAPGAAGKSTYLMARALCMATGVKRFRQQIWNGPHRVWLWNLEDKRLHLERMLQAFALRYGLAEEDLGGRLFLDSAVANAKGEGDYSPQILKLAGPSEQNGFTIYRPNVQALIDELRARQIDHLDVDPFVSSHGVPENDNGIIDEVAKAWAHIAAEANCSVSLAHHIKKIEGREATVQDSRGATALINACRSVLVINNMSGEQADGAGIPKRDRHFYFSMYDGKNNRAPPAIASDWFKKIGVGLGNGDVGCPGPEDNVATLEWFAPPSVWGGFSARQLRAVQERIEATGPAKCRGSSLSPQWVGLVIADMLDIPVKLTSAGTIDKCEGKQKLVTMISAWIDSDVLNVEQHMVGKSEMKPCIVVGRWVDPTETM